MLTKIESHGFFLDKKILKPKIVIIEKNLLLLFTSQMRIYIRTHGTIATRQVS